MSDFHDDVNPSSRDPKVCPLCGKEIITPDFKGPKDWKEYKMSGLCQKCQDDFFDEEWEMMTYTLVSHKRSSKMPKVDAPEGAAWVIQSLDKDGGPKLPILTWNSTDKLIAFMGEGAVLKALNGSGLGQGYKNSARRLAKNKRDEAGIAQAQLDYRPGERGRAILPKTALRRATVAAQGKVDDAQLAILLEKIAAGEVDVATLVGK